MNHDVQPALDALRGARAEAVTTLTDLIRIPSVGGTAAESDIVHHVATLLGNEGVELDLWPIPVAELAARADFPGMEVTREEAWGLVARLPGTEPGAPSLMLNGHLDVVPPGDPGTWTLDPWSGDIRDGHAYGRGACDMKGGFVSALSAFLALHRSRTSLRGDVLLAAVVGEEDGGLGTFATLQRGWRADACVITEPTALDVLAANGGALTFRLRVPGLAAHACARTSGVSAVEKFQLIFPVLRALEASRNRVVDPMMRRWDIAYPLEIGTVRAGDWASTVPDLLVAEGRFGVALDEPVDVARAAFEATVAEACAGDPWLKEHPVTVEWWGGQFASGRCPEGTDLVQRVVSAHVGAHGGTYAGGTYAGGTHAGGTHAGGAHAGGTHAGGAEPAVVGAPYGSDLRLLTGAGVPAVQYGPGVGYGHCPDERVSLEQVHTCAETLVHLAFSQQSVDTH